jgi:hypothetical protein
MKKSFILAATLGISILANAQIKLGVQGGVAASVSKLSGLTDKKAFATPTIGIIMQADLGGIMLRPSLNYLRSGIEGSTISSFSIPSPTPGGLPTASTLTAITETRVDNIEIPLDITLPLKAGKGKFLISAAPVATIGLKGKINNSYTATGAAIAPAPTSSEISFGGGAVELKKVDWGTRFGLGYEFKNGLQINTAYKLGLSNQSNANSTTLKNHHVAVTIAYFLFK